MNYYQNKLFLPHVDKDDNLLGKVERWEAHEKRVLHRGFTVAVIYQDHWLCQHRKHPLFDGYLDLTASSHPIFVDNALQNDPDAIYSTLEREWGVKKKELLHSPELKGKVMYRAKNGKYTEHEICSLYTTEVKSLPRVNFDYAYGFSLLKTSNLKSTNLPLTKILAPWVQEFIKEKLI